MEFLREPENLLNTLIICRDFANFRRNSTTPEKGGPLLRCVWGVGGESSTFQTQNLNISIWTWIMGSMLPSMVSASVAPVAAEAAPKPIPPDARSGHWSPRKAAAWGLGVRTPGRVLSEGGTLEALFSALLNPDFTSE